MKHGDHEQSRSTEHENSESKIIREDIVTVAAHGRGGEFHPVNGINLYFIFVPVADLEVMNLIGLVHSDVS